MLNSQRRLQDPEYSSLPVVFEDVGMAAFRIRYIYIFFKIKNNYHSNNIYIYNIFYIKEI